MSGAKEIQRRIKSVKSTKKITKAMELVAASKMKKALAETIASRLYATYSWDLLVSLSNKLEENTHIFFDEKESSKKNNKILLVLITSDRGLCGGYNSQIIKKAIPMIKEISSKDNTVDIVTIGKKGDRIIRKIGQNVIATFSDFSDGIKLKKVDPLSNFLTTEFKNGNYKEIYVAYTDFITAINQKSNIKKLLPISKENLKDLIENLGEGEKEIRDNNLKIPYIFEGNINNILESLTLKLVRMQIYQMLLESNASEQSSRMMAMKNANEAAGEMVDDLTLVFNKARQAGITREISEISAGMASI